LKQRQKIFTVDYLTVVGKKLQFSSNITSEHHLPEKKIHYGY